jgi:RNA-splicing ligase RtcB
MAEVTTKGIPIKGAHNEALVFAKAVEAPCEDKIRQYLDHPGFAGTKVRVMPDVHLGKGAVIGFTATMGEALIPSAVGVDIGCGVCAVNLGRGKLRFDKLDAFIRKYVPSGQNVHPGLSDGLESAVTQVLSVNNSTVTTDVDALVKAVTDLSVKQGYDPSRALCSLGTLGGGNHFIEVDVDEDHNRWLLIHSGSRIFGARVAEYHEIIALQKTDDTSPIKYLTGDAAAAYHADMLVAQQYARINRALMAHTIARGFFKVDLADVDYIESVHNYLDTDDGILRKGAIRAHDGEPVVIPFSMADGAIIGKGKGNPDWNFSAPHGAGRKVPRTQAKKGLSLDEFRKEMRGVWSSTVGKDTLEESPMAYKRPKDVLDYIGDTVEVEKRLKSVYNFKAVD